MTIKGIEGMTMADVQRELEQGGKFVIYQYTISILLMTFKRSSSIYFIRAGHGGKGLPFTLITLFFGWWGIPWGPIYSIASLATNLGGGKNVTTDVMLSLSQTNAQTA
jgi:hypothetical protein